MLVLKISPIQRRYIIALRWALNDLRSVDDAKARLLQGETITHKGSTYTLHTPNKPNQTLIN
jgi:hypothetical protein